MQARERWFTHISAAPHNRRMPGTRTAAAHRAPRRILVIDVGGTHIKFRVMPHGRIAKFTSGPAMGPKRMVHKLRKRLGKTAFDAVSIGYPGFVFHGRIAAEPHNLGAGWVKFDFTAAFGKPVRIVNDAAMQAVGSYDGGRMLFLGLGTGLGAAMVADGVVEPMELAHLPYKQKKTYEDFVGQRALERRGRKAWRSDVETVVA